MGDIVQELCAHKANAAIRNKKVLVILSMLSGLHTTATCMRHTTSCMQTCTQFQRERTPMHLACSCGRIPSAKQLAAYDRSTLDGRDKVK